MALIDKLTAIADAIRGKTGKTDALTLDQMAAEIAGITPGEVLGGNLEFVVGGLISNDASGNSDALNRISTGFFLSPRGTATISVENTDLGIKAFSADADYEWINYPSVGIGGLDSAVISGVVPEGTVYFRVIIKKRNDKDFSAEEIAAMEGAVMMVNDAKYILTQQISDAQALSIIMGGGYA